MPEFSSQICPQYTNSFIRIPERRDHSSGFYEYPRKNIESINKQTVVRIFSDCVSLISSQKEIKPLKAVLFPNVSKCYMAKHLDFVSKIR